jgi:hypothetical protein
MLSGTEVRPMVRIPAIDRSLGASPRTHSRRDVSPSRRRAVDFDVPTRGFARELAEIEPGQTVREARDWRADAYDATRRRSRWHLLDIIV